MQCYRKRDAGLERIRTILSQIVNRSLRIANMNSEIPENVLLMGENIIQKIECTVGKIAVNTLSFFTVKFCLRSQFCSFSTNFSISRYKYLPYICQIVSKFDISGNIVISV